MSAREAWLSAGLIFVAALVVRAAFASSLSFPTPEDTAYYVGVARNIVEGRGWVSDAIWSFQTPPLVFPRPAFEVWLPLPSLLALPAMTLLGPTFDAAKIAAVLVGSLVPVLAWRLALDLGEERGLPLGRARTLALGTGLTAVVYLPLVLFGALPDSTMPFAALVLAATLLMTRLLRRPPTGRIVRDPRLIGLGVVLGLAALTRNEAAWIALAWAGLVWWQGPRGRRLALVAVPAAIALVLFAPWAIRDWAVFGNPLPGQALANALSVTGFDIFAWRDPPTVSRYLAIGPARLLELRVEGIWHNLANVLGAPGFPISVIGLVALPWAAAAGSLRPLVVFAVVTFLVTSLLFPVATTWGTFLHAAGAIHVLLIVSALAALDALIVRAGQWRGWTRPVAWLGPTLTIASAVLFSLALTTYADQSSQVARRYQLLAERMAAIGRPLDATAGPIVTDFPIWLAEARRVRTLGLPDESPADVVDLAKSFPGARYLVMTDEDRGAWPGVLGTTAPGADCFTEIDLGPPPGDPADARSLAKTRVFEIGCL
ncbi:MAG: hypothetical protein QOF11_458 [Chloroflexota bacterium]|jgi:hypothetical protein|nr:hypothetical protein [Chloroflexota bacterium]